MKIDNRYLTTFTQTEANRKKLFCQARQKDYVIRYELYECKQIKYNKIKNYFFLYNFKMYIGQNCPYEKQKSICIYELRVKYLNYGKYGQLYDFIMTEKIEIYSDLYR